MARNNELRCRPTWRAASGNRNVVMLRMVSRIHTATCCLVAVTIRFKRARVQLTTVSRTPFVGLLNSLPQPSFLSRKYVLKSIVWYTVKLYKPDMLIGYARVSTEDQNLDLQRNALRKAGCKKIFEEKEFGPRRDQATGVRSCPRLLAPRRPVGGVEG